MIRTKPEKASRSNEVKDPTKWKWWFALTWTDVGFDQAGKVVQIKFVWFQWRDTSTDQWEYRYKSCAENALISQPIYGPEW